MKVFWAGSIAITLGLMLSSTAGAQTATPDLQAVPSGWTLPAELVSKRLPDDALKASNGNFDALLKNTPGDAGRIPGLTQGFVLTSPSGLPQVINFAAQSTTNEEASAVGLGLCTTTAALMNAANNPATPPAQGQAARNLARNILSSVSAASAASTRTNQVISTSFGVAVNANGGVAVTCKSLTGETVATTAVAPAAAASNAGVGSPVNEGADPAGGGSLFRAAERGGGAGRQAAFTSGPSGSSFTPNNGARFFTTNVTTITPVPGPEAGAGALPLAGLVTYLFIRYRRKPSGAAVA